MQDKLDDLRKLHQPVLVNEVLKAFQLSDKALSQSLRIIDATLGIGGHTEYLLRCGVNVLGIDDDSKMLELAGKRLSLALGIERPQGLVARPTPENNVRGSYNLVKGNFKDIDKIAIENKFINVDGILFDLGVSSPQITSSDRGFSFQYDESTLDMRIDQEGMGVKASDLLNILREDQLVEMFSRVLNLSKSKKLAEIISIARKRKKIEKVGEFKKIIARVITRSSKKRPETLPFLALRIAVNSELENIWEGLNKGINLIKPKGRMLVISFHSTEDALTNEIFSRFQDLGYGFQITKNPIVPGQEELLHNNRSRSSLLRIFEKI